MLKRLIDPNQRVEIDYKKGWRGRWRWIARYGEIIMAVSPVRGYDTWADAKEAAESILNVEGE